MRGVISLEEAAHAVASNDPIEQRAARLAAKHGCKKCGMVGCHCHEVEDTFSASVCKKCRTQPCECEGKTVPRAVGGVCRVCHRSESMCACKSHYPVKATIDPAVRQQFASSKAHPLSDEYVEKLVNEFMASFYYPRDAYGGARWLRKHLR